MKSQFDKGRTDITFEIGDQVLVKLQKYRQDSLAQRKSHELDRTYYGPYKVLSRISDMAYELQLPSNAHIHNVFHVSLLKKFHQGVESISAALPDDFCKLKDELGTESGGDVATQLPLKCRRQSPSAMRDFVTY